MSTNAKRTILVTGAGGHLGRKVVELLLEAGGDHVVAASRSIDKLSDLKGRGAEVRSVDFDKPESLDTAFKGVDRVLVISTDALDRPGHRLEQQLAAVAGAKRAGVKHIVYTSLTNPGPESLVVAIAPDHRGTEAAIAATGIEHTILRNNLYTDLLLTSLPHAVASGELRSGAGTGGIGYVTRDDCARAAAAALRSHHVGSRTLDVTGPASVTQAELAATLAKVTGRPVKYVPLTIAQAIEGLVAAGLPAGFAAVYASFDASAAAGQLNVASDAVKQLTDKAPESVEAFLGRHRAELTKGG